MAAHPSGSAHLPHKAVIASTHENLPMITDIFKEDMKSEKRDLERFLSSHKECYGSKWLTDYEIKRKVGQGTFGEVLEAYHKQDQSHVALKRLIVENKQEGFPLTAMRELSILSELCHDNIISLRDHILDDNLNHYLVFDFCQQDLAGLLSCPKVSLSKSQQKAIMIQLFRGLYYLHGRGYVHRDIKAANILLAKNGTLKIADFGLARKVVIDAYDLPEHCTHERPPITVPAPVYTSTVITRWYRPIELLISNSGIYDTPVDIWGAGCVMVELWSRKAILPGKNDMDQLHITIELLGSINEQNWPGFEKQFPNLNVRLPANKPGRLDSVLDNYLKNDLQAMDLVKQCLRLDPKQRADAGTCTDHIWFHTEPYPGDIELLANYGVENFELLSNERRQKEHQQQQATQNTTTTGVPPQASTNHRHAPHPMHRHNSSAVGGGHAHIPNACNRRNTNSQPSMEPHANNSSNYHRSGGGGGGAAGGLAHTTASSTGGSGHMYHSRSTEGGGGPVPAQVPAKRRKVKANSNAPGATASAMKRDAKEDSYMDIF